MKLVACKGSNYRNYLKIEDLQQSDLSYFKILEGVVSRSEYKPFSRGFDKTVRKSYFINKTFIPAQFMQDIQQNFCNVYPNKLTFENTDILYNLKINKEHFLDFCETVQLPPKYDIFKEEYEYQIESVYRAILFKTARIEIGTGGGKTLITYLYCRYLLENFLPAGRKILIIVPKVDLAKQTAKNFTEYQELNDSKITFETIYSGSKRVDNAQVVIGTWQSLKDYEQEYFDIFSCMICDEAHSAKAYNIRENIYNKCLNVEFLFGVTGTYPKYNSLDYLNIVAMFGPLVFTKKTHELIKDGNVCPVEINKIWIDYNDDEREFSKNLKLSGTIGAEKYRIEKKFFQNHIPRTNVIKKLCQGFEGNHLILVENVEYVEFLRDYLIENCPDKDIQVIHGSIKGDERVEIRERMEQVSNIILIATYETMSTGVSINNIAYVHFPDGGRSEIRIKQSVGRGLRLHPSKEYLIVFDYQDNIPQSSFLSHSKERNKIYEEEKHPSKLFKIEVEPHIYTY